LLFLNRALQRLNLKGKSNCPSSLVAGSTKL